MVLANCEYSFEIGKGTKIEYDFGGLQRQIIDRLLFPKSFIQIGHVMQVSISETYRTTHGVPTLGYPYRVKFLVRY